MKHIDQKKQDLLLDALSYIDEDILARGLTLREGDCPPGRDTAKAVAETAPTSTSPQKDSRATQTPPLYDLSPLPPRSPKKNPRQVLSVVAAACLLVCLVPLSMWVAARFGVNIDFEESDKAEEKLEGTHAEIRNPVTDGNMIPEDAPMEPTSPEPDLPILEDPEHNYEISDSTVEEETALPVVPYSPEAWTWTKLSSLNGRLEKTATVDLSGSFENILHYTYTARVDTLTGSQDALEGFYAQTVKPEDEMVLDIYAQHCLSLYTMDYGSHFLLFHPDIVKLHFTHEVQPYPYNQALGRINTLVALMLPYDSVAVDMSLTENRLLSGNELTSYLENAQKRLNTVGLSAAAITAVRHFAVTGTVTVGGRFIAENWDSDSDFYCYEYNGVWYLDVQYLDDDLCVDFALSDIVMGQDYLKPDTHRGVVSAIEDGYIHLEDGYVFATEDIASAIAESGVAVGDQVHIQHYDFGLPVRLTDTEQGTLYRAITLVVYDASAAISP